MSNESKSGAFLRGLRDGVPIGLGYLSVSFAFGITAVSKGVPAWIAVLISMTNVTSAGQLAGLDLMVVGASMWEMILTQCVINLRYSLMSVSLSQKTGRDIRLCDRFLIAFCNTDEVFAVASSQSGLVGRYYMFGLICAPYFGWSLGTLLGAVASGLLSDAIMSALGIAIYGMFVAIIIPPARKSRPVALVLLCAVVLSCLFRYVPVLNQVSSGFVIIISAVVAASLGAYFAPIADDGNEAENPSTDDKTEVTA